MTEPPRKLVITKLFGVILMAVGALDTMLSWRAGLPQADFHFSLLFAGMLLYALGAIRGARGPARSNRSRSAAGPAGITNGCDEAPPDDVVFDNASVVALEKLVKEDAK